MGSLRILLLQGLIFREIDMKSSLDGLFSRQFYALSRNIIPLRQFPV